MSLKWQSGSHLVVPGSNPSLTFSNFSCSRRPGVRENRGSHSFESLCVLRQVGVQASMRTAVLRTSCRQVALFNGNRFDTIFVTNFFIIIRPSKVPIKVTMISRLKIICVTLGHLSPFLHIFQKAG